MSVFELMAFLGFCYTVFKIGYRFGRKSARKNRPTSSKR